MERYNLTTRTVPLPNQKNVYIPIKTARDIVKGAKLLKDLSDHLNAKIITKRQYDYTKTITKVIYRLEENSILEHYNNNEYVRNRINAISKEPIPHFNTYTILYRYYRRFIKRKINGRKTKTNSRVSS